MIKKSKLILNIHIPIILYCSINCLFIIKYSIRYSIPSVLSTILYIALIAVIIQKTIISRGITISKKKTITFYWLLILLVILAIIILHKLINPYELQVDRWSAIHNFLTYLFQGKYPYSANTHLGGYGSPFPVWQLFHIPFYLMGNVALAFEFILIVLSVSLLSIFKSYRKSLLYLLLLVLSPAFWYEVAVRSDLLYNFLLCFILCALLFLNKISIKKHPWKLGILCGLFLSTRFSIVIPFAIVLFSDFWYAVLKNKFIFILAGLLSFVLSFLPFLLWDWNNLLFFKFNPFILQTRQGSLFELFLLLVLVIIFSINVKGSIKNAFLFTALTIILFVSFTFLHRMYNENFENGLFSSSFDITYFNMALPFVIYLISGFTKQDVEVTKT